MEYNERRAKKYVGSGAFQDFFPFMTLPFW